MNHAVQWSDLWPSSIACAVQSPRSFAFSLLSSTALLNTLQKFSCVLWIGWNIGSFSITDGFSPNGLPFQLVQPLHPSRPLLLLSSCLDHIIRIWTRKNKKLKVGWFYLFFFFFISHGWSKKHTIERDLTLVLNFLCNPPKQVCLPKGSLYETHVTRTNDVIFNHLHRWVQPWIFAWTRERHPSKPCHREQKANAFKGRCWVLSFSNLF